MARSYLIAALVAALVCIALADTCGDQTNCQDCVDTTNCGWCSTNVIGGNGKHCAGTDGIPFVCIGTYSTTDCTQPPPPPPPPLVPTTPTNVIGQWRGLEVNDNYVKGEWDANFTEKNITLIAPDGQQMTGAVSSDATSLNIDITSGQYQGMTAMGIYEVSFGPVCSFLTWALSQPGLGEAPPSFAAAMNSTTAVVYAFEKPLPR